MTDGGYTGQLVALDVNNTPFDITTPLTKAAQLSQLQLANQNAALDFQVKKASLAARSALVQSFGPQAQSAPAAPVQSPLAAVAQVAQASNDPASWDDNMRALAKAGNPAAAQFIGKFNAKDQFMTAWNPGGAAPPAAGASSPLAQAGTGAGATSALSGGGGAVDPGTAPAAPSTPLGMSDQQLSALQNLAIYDPQGAQQMLSMAARLRYQKTGDINDLRYDPEAQQHAAAAMKDMSDTQKQNYVTATDAAARAAEQALQMPAGPARDAFMHANLEDLQKRGIQVPGPIMAQGQWTDQALQQTRLGGMLIKDAYEATGEQAGNEAARRFPYEAALKSVEGAQARMTKAAPGPVVLHPGEDYYPASQLGGAGAVGGGGSALAGVAPAGVPRPAGGGSALAGSPPAAPAGPVAPGAGAGGSTTNPVAPAAPVTPARAGPIVTGQNPADIAYAKAQAEKLVDYQVESADKAAAAVASNNDWDNLRANATQWQQGKFSDVISDAKASVVGLLQNMGIKVDPKAYDNVANWEDFNKTSQVLVREAARATSSRVGIQELQMVQRSLVNDETSPQGFRHIADQAEAINDYTIAKAEALAQFRGNRIDFDNQINKNITPAAFWALRMSNDDWNNLSANLSKTAQGRVQLDKIKSEVGYLQANKSLFGLQ